ncbi:MAG: S41 family peptidase [Steroidobacteraceae bacterium]
MLFFDKPVSFSDRKSLLLAPILATVLLPACGGGGGGGGGAPAAGSPNSAPAWVAGQFAPASAFAARCVAPRSGINPATGQAYADRPGTALDEKNWLRSWTNDLYLWFGEVADQDPAGFASDALYFDALKTPASTPSGKPKDRFHFTYPTAAWESLSQSGVAPGYGVTFSIVAGTPPRNVLVAYTEPGSPAAIAPANLSRGAKILAVDGVDLVNANDQASINTLNSGLSPKTSGESHTFSILDSGATSARTVTLVSGNITETPVQSVQSISTAAGDTVGYMLFNDHIATAESELVAAFTQLKNAGVHDLILDIRYNGGGYLDIASEVAYMIAGPAATRAQTFELTQFNSKHPTVDPVTQTMIMPLGFHTTTQGFSGTAGQALPTLNLARVFLITGAGTCSASESIINSLEGISVEVIQIGSTTCGKPYGFYPADNCAVTYFSIQFQGINAKGFGAYPDGFTPANTNATEGVRVPGCSVADDFAHALGDPAEARLQSALGYRATGVCPLPPSGVQPAGPLEATASRASGALIKPVWRQNRIYRGPARQ